MSARTPRPTCCMPSSHLSLRVLLTRHYRACCVAARPIAARAQLHRLIFEHTSISYGQVWLAFPRVYTHVFARSCPAPLLGDVCVLVPQPRVTRLHTRVVSRVSRSRNHVHEGLVAHARRYSSKCWRVGPDTENGEQCGAVLNPREEGDCYNREHVWPVRRLSSPTGTSNCSWRTSPVSVFAVPRGGLNFELSLPIVSIVLKLNTDSQVGSHWTETLRLGYVSRAETQLSRPECSSRDTLRPD